MSSDYTFQGNYVPLADVTFDNTQHVVASARWKVSVGGVEVYPTAFTLDLNGHGATDTGSFTLPIAQMPDWSILLHQDADDGVIDVEFFVGFPADETVIGSPITYVSMFIGIIDIMNPIFDTFEVTFDCRSYAAILTATKITTTASVQTTTDFITGICNKYGLTAKITLPKDPKSGVIALPATLAQVFGKELTVGLHNAVVWSVILACGEVDDCLVWVEGTTLHYENPDSVERTTQELMFGRDLLHLRGNHAPQRNGNIMVEGRTVNPKTRHSVTVRTITAADGTAKTNTTESYSSNLQQFGGNGSVSVNQSYNPATGATTTRKTTSQSSGGFKQTGFTGFEGENGKEHYILRIANQTLAQMNARVMALWKQLSRAEYSIEFEIVLTPSLLAVLAITTLWRVTGMPWDGFNSIAATGGSTVNSGGQVGPPGSASPGSANSPITSTPDQVTPKDYYARKISLAGTMPQNTSGVETSGGLTCTITAVNHALPAQAV